MTRPPPQSFLARPVPLACARFLAWPVRLARAVFLGRPVPPACAVVPVRRWLAVLALLSAAANALLLGTVAIQHAAIAAYARDAERDWALVRQIVTHNTEAVRRMRAMVEQAQVKALAVCRNR